MKKKIICCITAIYIILSVIISPVTAFAESSMQADLYNQYKENNSYRERLNNSTGVLYGMLGGVDTLNGESIAYRDNEKDNGFNKFVKNSIKNIGDNFYGYIFGGIDDEHLDKTNSGYNIHNILGFLPVSGGQDIYSDFMRTLENAFKPEEPESSNQIGNIGTYFIYCNLDNVYLYNNTFYDTYEELKSKGIYYTDRVYFFEHIDGLATNENTLTTQIILSENNTNYYKCNLNTNKDIISKTSLNLANYSKDNKSVYFTTVYTLINAVNTAYLTYYYKNISYKVTRSITYSASQNSSLVYRDYYNIPESGTGIVPSTPSIADTYSKSPVFNNIYNQQQYTNITYASDNGHYYSNYNSSIQYNYPDRYDPEHDTVQDNINLAIKSGAKINIDNLCLNLGLTGNEVLDPGGNKVYFDTADLCTQMEILTDTMSKYIKQDESNWDKLFEYMEISPGFFKDTETDTIVSPGTITDDSNYKFQAVDPLRIMSGEAVKDALKATPFKINDFDLFATSISVLFPFCMVYDMMKIGGFFMSHEPKPPEFDIHLSFVEKYAHMDKWETQTYEDYEGNPTNLIKYENGVFTVSLARFNGIAKMSRIIFNCLFIVGLIVGLKRFTYHGGGD